MQLRGSDEYKERALQLALERGMRDANPELRELQDRPLREMELERQRSATPIRYDVMRIIDRDLYGLGSEAMLVERWDPKTRMWETSDAPPIRGEIHFGEVHVVRVVRVYADGRHEVDDARTESWHLEREQRREQQRERERGGYSR